MGFFKKATASYPATRNRINQNHPATVNPPPPSNYGAHNPQPMPASVYQANGISAAAATAAPPAAAAATATYNASSYGAFPDNSAPVQATVYVPGQQGAQATAAAAATTVAPVVATAYVPGSAPPAAAHTATAIPVQATAYNPNGAVAYGTTPPATNPLYGQGTSFNNGNATYNTNESSFWECSICTFPNMRTEAQCKGCASPIPPGLLLSAASAAQQQQQQQQQQRPPQDTSAHSNMINHMNSQMNGMSLGGGTSGGARAPTAGTSAGVMRVHIPNGMRPGQKIKVRSPDGKEVVKVIPPQSEWAYDDSSRPFFRMQFGSSQPADATAAHASHGTAPTVAHEVPPPHSTSWHEYQYDSASARYHSPPLGSRDVPHMPYGMGSGIPPNGRHKSLIIGINYTGTRAQLAGCINDAKNMQGMLQRNGYPNDGSHMLLLTDERSRGREYQPTVENIMKAFAWFMKDVRRGDVLFFHFSGHGGQVPDKTGHEIDGYNETVIPVDFERKGQISDDILWGSLVYKLPEGARITALMDMCHSGTGLDLPYDYNVDTGRWKEDVNPAHSAGDVVLFSGCEDSQTSADVSGGFGKQAGGAMTQAFMGAYESSAGAMSSYHDFLKNVKAQLRRKRFKQRPQLTSSQRFDTNSRIFSLGYQSSSGGIPSIIEPNHNPKVGRQKNRHVRPAGQGFGGGGGAGDIFGLAGAAIGAALIADALF